MVPFAGQSSTPFHGRIPPDGPTGSSDSDCCESVSSSRSSRSALSVSAETSLRRDAIELFSLASRRSRSSFRLATRVSSWRLLE